MFTALRSTTIAQTRAHTHVYVHASFRWEAQFIADLEGVWGDLFRLEDLSQKASSPEFWVKQAS